MLIKPVSLIKSMIFDASTFSNKSLIEEATKCLFRISLRSTHSIRMCFTVSGHWRFWRIVGNGGLSRLHSADEDAVSWLTNYGKRHAYEKKKWALTSTTFGYVILERRKECCD